MSPESQLKLLQLLFGPSSEEQDKLLWTALASLRNQIIGFDIFGKQSFEEEKGRIWRIQKLTAELSAHDCLTQELIHSIGYVCKAYTGRLFIKNHVDLGRLIIKDSCELIEQLVKLNKHLLQLDILFALFSENLIGHLPSILSIIKSRKAYKWFSNEDGYNNFLVLLKHNDLENVLSVLEGWVEEKTNTDYFNDFQTIRDQLLNPEWKAERLMVIKVTILYKLVEWSKNFDFNYREDLDRISGIPLKLFNSLLKCKLTTKEAFDKLSTLIEDCIIPQSSYSKTIDAIDSLLLHAHIFTHDSVFHSLEKGDYYPDLRHITSPVASVSAITESMFLQQLREKERLLEEAKEQAQSHCQELVDQRASTRRSGRFSP